MTSAAEVRDILLLPQASANPAAPAPKPKKAAAGPKRPQGVGRELYNLIGDNAPQLQVALSARPRFKAKADFGGKVKWELVEFTNEARTDGLKLKHWQKVSADPPAQYPFAQYKTDPQVFTYTDEEYTEHLQDEEWSREETDYLFSLLRDFDMRFVVVADRYEFPDGPSRTIEDMKARYYSCCRKLIRSRPWTGEESAKTQLLASYQFDKEQEVTRKRYVMGLFSRTPEQIAEEEALYIECKRLEQTERRFTKERDDLLRTLGGIESGLPGIKVDDETWLALQSDPKRGQQQMRRKSRAGDMDIDSPVASTSGSNLISIGQPRKPKDVAKQAIYDAQHCIYRIEPAHAIPTKQAHQPAYLRTVKFPVPKPTVITKVSALLTELGFSHTRLVMPTRDTNEAMERLQNVATTLVDVKRMIDRVDQEMKTIKERFGIKDNASSGTANSNAMDVDPPEGSSQV